MVPGTVQYIYSSGSYSVIPLPYRMVLVWIPYSCTRIITGTSTSTRTSTGCVPYGEGCGVSSEVLQVRMSIATG